MRPTRTLDDFETLLRRFNILRGPWSTGTTSRTEFAASLQQEFDSWSSGDFTTLFGLHRGLGYKDALEAALKGRWMKFLLAGLHVDGRKR